MANRHTDNDANDRNVRPPEPGEPMNDEQREYLELLTEEAGERLDPNLDQVAAARLIRGAAHAHRTRGARAPARGALTPRGD